MSRGFAMQNENDGASGLSAEAEVFIPRQSSHHGNTSMDIQQIPSYMTNCYPFIQGGMNRNPWIGNQRQPRHNHHGYQGARKQNQRFYNGYQNQRMPGPQKYGEPVLPPGGPPLLDPPWNAMFPPSTTMSAPGGLLPFPNHNQNHMPFDGGTDSRPYRGRGRGRGQNRSQEVGLQGPSRGRGGRNIAWQKGSETIRSDESFIKDTGKSNRKFEGDSLNKGDNTNVKRDDKWRESKDRKNDQTVQKGRHETGGSKVNVRSEVKPKTTGVMILKEIALQTDFPDSISCQSLLQVPSALYCGSSIKDSSDTDQDSDSGYYSPLHRRNQVSSGTHTAELLQTITFNNTSSNQSASAKSDSPVAVPQQRMSYAMIAQKVPSQNISNKTVQSICDNSLPSRSSKKEENDCFSARNFKTSSDSVTCDAGGEWKNSHRKPGINGKKSDTNPHQTSVLNKNSLDNSKNENTNHNCGINITEDGPPGEKRKRKRNRKRRRKKKPGEAEDSDKEQQGEEVDLHFEDEQEFPDLLGSIATSSKKKEYSREITPQREIIQSNNLDIENHIEPFNSVDNNPNSEFKQINLTTEPPSDLNYEMEREIIPTCFTTESEINISPVPTLPSGVMSYSSILKTKKKPTVTFEDSVTKSSQGHTDKNVSRSKSAGQGQTSNVKAFGQGQSSSQSLDLSNKENDQDGFITEEKVSKKRRKRREMVNKAAEEELAEINLEQDMLRELNLKPLTKKAGQQSTRKAANSKELSTPGLLKVNPTPQPSSGGKKTKQGMALDLGAIIDALEKKKDVSVEKKFAAIAASKDTSSVPKSKKKGDGPHNMLDSSAPVIKRGKERENPKPKKPSPLKKVILKEREEKKKLKLLEDGGPDNSGAPVGIGVVSAESDLSQDALSFGGYGVGTPASNESSPVSQNSPISMSPLSPGASPLSSEVNSPIAGMLGKEAIVKIHSRRFREYCNQVLNKDIDNCCTELLQDLVRFQDRVYHKEPVKAKSKRRFVLGLREVTKHLKLKKLKCVIISPNLEKIQSKGGLDDALNNILNLSTEQNIPFVFALGRRSLGRACAKLVPVSVVGIFNYDGTEEKFKNLMELTEEARNSYKEMVNAIEREIREYPMRNSGASTPHIYAHMGHSRTPSGASVLSFTSSILSEPISENYPHSEPETDSKGYEIVRKEQGIEKYGFNPGPLSAGKMGSMLSKQQGGRHRDFDDGNEADTEDLGEAPRVKGHYGDSDSDGSGHDSQGGSDTVEDLPHIDSIHSSTYDLSTEMLSQNSGRTIENCENMSTHSSRTLGDGSSTILADQGDRSKHGTPKESPSSTLQRGKVIDEERIQLWVEETQTRLDNLQQETTDDDSDVSDSESETEANSVDEIDTNCTVEVDIKSVKTDKLNKGQNSVISNDVKHSTGQINNPKMGTEGQSSKTASEGQVSNTRTDHVHGEKEIEGQKTEVISLDKGHSELLSCKGQGESLSGKGQGEIMNDKDQVKVNKTDVDQCDMNSAIIS